MLLLAGVASLALAASRPWLLASLAWVAASFAPTSGLIQHGLVTDGADRYCYMPLLGVVALVAVGVGADADATPAPAPTTESSAPASRAQASAPASAAPASTLSRTPECAARARGVALSAVCVAFVALLAWASGQQAQHWRSDEVLWRRSIAVDSSDWRALDTCVRLASAARLIAPPAPHESARCRPRSTGSPTCPHSFLSPASIAPSGERSYGEWLFKQGRRDEATALLPTMMKFAPRRGLKPALLRARTHVMLSDTQKACEYYAAAMKIFAPTVALLNNAGICHLREQAPLAGGAPKAAELFAEARALAERSSGTLQRHKDTLAANTAELARWPGLHSGTYYSGSLIF